MVLISQGIHCDHRATLPIKGKGVMSVYVVSDAARENYQRLDSVQRIDVFCSPRQSMAK